MREKQLFVCSPGEPERPLGRGEQACVAVGPDGFHLLWIVGRPGTLMTMSSEASEPRRLAELANDPVIAAPVHGKGPVVAVWEEGTPGAMRIHSLVLSSTK
jgi:hypothetical protein